MSETTENYLQAFVIERPNGSIYLQFFTDKNDAYDFIEEKYNMTWASIKRKHKLKIVKVEVIRKKWR